MTLLNKNDDALNVLIDEVVIIFKKMSKKLKYDKSITGTILSINENGTYKVLTEDNIETELYSCAPLDIHVTDKVWINIPAGKWNKKFIYGKVVR